MHCRGEAVSNDGIELPGSRSCVGCDGLTFRNRDDGLCPRCAYSAERLIEQIELDSLDRDLTLMTRFEAYYRQRELRLAAVGRPFEGAGLRPQPFTRPPLWPTQRSA